MNRRSCALVLAALAAGCGGKSSKSSGEEPAADPSAGTTAETPVTPLGEAALFLKGYPQDATDGDDAVTYTAGMMKLAAVGTLGGYAVSAEHAAEPITLTVDRAAYLVNEDGTKFDVAKLTDAEKTLLSTYCRETAVSAAPFDDPAAPTLATTLGFDGLYFGWRSHFKQSDRDALAAFYLEHGRNLYCALEVGFTMARATKTTGLTVAFDPAPTIPAGVHPATDYTGTADYTTALAELTMLVAVRGHEAKPFDSSWTKVPVAEGPTFSRKKLALNASKLAVEATPDAGATPCDVRLTTAYKVTNPTASQTPAFKVAHGDVAVTLASVKPALVAGGQASTACSNLAPQITSASDATFSVALTCAQYKELLDAPGCGFAVAVANAADAANDVVLKPAISGLSGEVLDLSDPVNAESILPEAAGNPLRPLAVTMTAFTTPQTDVLARSFDLWLGASKASYDTYFVGQVNTMEFDPDTSVGGNCDGAGAYAQLNSHKVYWCGGGGLSPDFLPPNPTAHQHVYRAMTALHETLHTRGNPHDIDYPTNQPCSPAHGTAYSAVVGVDVFNCTEDWCYGFKDAAVREFQIELDYSLASDARRFQGQCKTWADLLGVSFQ